MKLDVPGMIAGVLLALTPSTAFAERIADPEVLAAGQRTFRANCAGCHGSNAEGIVKDWRKPVDGKYPPPPLNGTAHAWHHPFSQLVRVIKNGTKHLGGSMPAWGDKLSDEEIANTVHYLISLWPEDVRGDWEARGGYQK